MLVGRITKEQTDTNRVTVDFSSWLDTSEAILEVVSLTVAVGTSGWSTSPFTAAAPYDPTPVEIANTTTLIDSATQVQFWVDGGTPGNVYTATLLVRGTTSQRELTVEVEVQISGTPPTTPPVVPTPVNLTALSILGGTMQGPLYAFEDPLTPGEMVTKRYADHQFAVALTTTADEATARAAADTTLTTALAAEATTRASADTTNATAVTTEATTRAAAITTLTTNLASEATTRASADSTNATAITSEASTRASAITTVAASVTTEATARAAADATNAAAIAAEVTARSTAITALDAYSVTETTDRIAADGVLSAAIAAETTRAEAAEAAIAATFTTQSGSSNVDGTGHIRITFSPAFASTCHAFVPVSAGAGFYSVTFSVLADRTGADVYATQAGSSTPSAGAGFYWIATGT